ncbi:2OG-Fe(II) oxygenase [Phaeodactylibacter luteus]|uniref:2OG-Fe(II) oxygenase n=1 Tax=Phaeodactylibacter luteus TaxID=1564516 RepID=A0A5C6RVE9_9BACT|nr:2OG-Fe(II) oxygenase [Phaeodactylibacter luteus]TXB66331.1 2OG-Fe(II) oxygenase [Phaeodactylibacter luteus]
MTVTPLSKEELRFEQAVQDLLSQQYAVLDHFLSAEEVGHILQTLHHNLHAGRFNPAGIGRQAGFQVNQDIRKDHIQWLDHDHPPEGCTVFFSRLQALTDYLNRTCFLGIRDMEMHFAVYQPGGFYKRHLDVFHQAQSRKLSAICYLNPGWKEEDGGALQLYLPQPDGSERTETLLPLAGRLVLFDSQVLEHEVQVARRERCSITGWLKDEPRLF